MERRSAGRFMTMPSNPLTTEVHNTKQRKPADLHYRRGAVSEGGESATRGRNSCIAPAFDGPSADKLRRCSRRLRSGTVAPRIRSFDAAHSGRADAGCFRPGGCPSDAVTSANLLYARNVVRLRQRFETFQLCDWVPKVAFSNSGGYQRVPAAHGGKRPADAR